MKRLCIIPAREGSKRVPLKNIKDFCGQPMLAYAVQAVQQSRLFDEIHVSTDSEKVADVARKLGVAPAFLRSPELTDDHTPLMPVLKSIVETYKSRGQVFDTVTLVYATAPLLMPDDLVQACTQFEEGDMDQPLISVTSYPAPIEKAFRIKGDCLVPDDIEAFTKRSQDLTPAYHDAAMFIFYSSGFLDRAAQGGDFSHFRGYMVPSYRVVDIDWPEDWLRAEAMYRALQH